MRRHLTDDSECVSESPMLPGCHSTELSLSCPAGEMLIIHSAHFTPSNNKLNCSSITRHSQVGREVGETRRSRQSEALQVRDLAVTDAMAWKPLIMP